MTENNKSFKTLATTFDCGVEVDLDHNYTSAGGEIANVSVTKILHPNGVPNFDHIKDAAAFGSQVHGIISDFLLQKFSDNIGNTELAVKSAKVIVHKLSEFLSTFRPKKLYRGPRTKVVLSYHPDVKMIAKYLPTDANIGGAADLVIEITTENGGLNNHMVVEFKTTKNTSKDHKLQVAAYMDFLGAQHGLIIYDDPEIQSIYIDQKDQKDLMKCFTKKANDYFFGDVTIESEDAEELESVVLNLKELQQQVKKLESERSRLFEKIVTSNEKASFALQFGVDVIVGNTKLQLVENTTKKLDYHSFKETHPILYKKLVTENKYYCKKFYLLNDSTNLEGGE